MAGVFGQAADNFVISVVVGPGVVIAQPNIPTPTISGSKRAPPVSRLGLVALVC